MAKASSNKTSSKPLLISLEQVAVPINNKIMAMDRNNHTTKVINRNNRIDLDINKIKTIILGNKKDPINKKEAIINNKMINYLDIE